MGTKAKVSNNPLLSDGVITIDGTEYRLEFDMRGLAAAEDATGLSLITGIGEYLTKPPIKVMAGLFYGLAKKHHPGLTYDAVVGMMTPQNMPDMWSTATSVYSSAFAPKNE